jgi:hypothetical protein
VDDGLYFLRTDGDGPRVRLNDGSRVVLGRRLGPAAGKLSMWSLRNDNSEFEFRFSPRDPMPDEVRDGPTVLVADGVPVRTEATATARNRNGSLELYGTVEGDVAADLFGERLRGEVRRRVHPGHRFEVTWTPDRREYKVGEPVKLKLRLRNAGTTAVRFAALRGGGGPGGAFRFLAHRRGGHGEPVPEIAERDLTRLLLCSNSQTLRPGETYTETIALDKWFRFDRPDEYRVTGIIATLVRPDNDDRPLDWEEVAAADCRVRVVKAD